MGSLEESTKEKLATAARARLEELLKEETSYRAALEQLRVRVENKRKELAAVGTSIRALRALLGEPKPAAVPRAARAPTHPLDPEAETHYAVVGLSVRAERACDALGAKTLRELSTHTEAAVLRTRGVGRKALRELRGLLSRAGLTFAGEATP